ncbi:MAG: DEAD/DEAH box helicase [Planctomycetes bacterium]|nr:DEAD/DEAH box helicase [Planctomycetota bacterium]
MHPKKPNKFRPKFWKKSKHPGGRGGEGQPGHGHPRQDRAAHTERGEQPRTEKARHPLHGSASPSNHPKHPAARSHPHGPKSHTGPKQSHPDRSHAKPRTHEHATEDPHAGDAPHARRSGWPSQNPVNSPLIARGGADDAPRNADLIVEVPPVKQFSELALAPTVLKALIEEGYTTPTPIQSQAIPPAMAGRDLLGCAQTGTGKTAAFALPILHLLQTQPRDLTNRGPYLPRVLVLSPTRELATQIGESFANYGRHTGVRGVCIFGGVSQGRQVRAIRDGVDVLVATPGRLIDLLEQKLVDLSQIKIFVLDEADRMLDMGFIAPIRRIVGMLSPERQTMMFSATMPREIMKLADSLLRNPVKVAVTPVASAAPLIEQSLYMVDKRMKPALLQHLLEQGQIARAVVFTKTKHGADRLAKTLHRGKVTAVAIHGNKAQNQRERALDAFRTGRCRVLVATDVAARGLDVDGITHVFNFDLPMEPEAYVHRIGRTGRAGAKGIAISFCSGEERGLMRDIERTTGKKFNPIWQLPDLPEPPEPAHHEHEEQRPREHGGQSHHHGARQRPGSRPGWNRPRHSGGR